MRRFNILLFIGIIILSTLFISEATTDLEEFEVLVLNSYHEGYKWSDDIMEGIKIQFAEEVETYNISIEYMDTKNNSSQTYLMSLYDFLEKKYKSKEYDLIIASDDAAFNFMQDKGQEIFLDTPYVFCGVNYFDGNNIEQNFTGIIESYDIVGTIDTAIKLNENLKNIYIINDQTTTGLSIQKEVDRALENFKDLSFYSIGQQSIEAVMLQASQLEDDSMILFCVYFEDGNGDRFNYDESIKMISDVASVPIYGMWEFLMNNGLTGGNLTSGYKQGRDAATYGVVILEGVKPCHLEIIKEQEDNYQYDYTFLSQFGLSEEKLPRNSILINQAYSDKPNILVLHSYHQQMAWVQGIEEGIFNILDGGNYNIQLDYMDTKRVASPLYLKLVYDQMILKHSRNSYDMIIISDNNAFNFMVKYGNKIFEEVPIVFCGLNNYQGNKELILDNMTGVIESIDIVETIDLMIHQNPKLNHLLVINDQTPTGLANQPLIEAIALQYDSIEFEFITDTDMSDLLKRVETLDDSTAVLLMSFNKDQSNEVFSYVEAGKLISTASSRPVYVLWDFYMNTGVVGGKVTSGITQGEVAAGLAKAILEGHNVVDTEIVLNSPNQYYFDREALKRFMIEDELIPEGSIIINEELTFLERYKVPLRITSLSIIIILFLLFDAKKKEKKNIQEQKILEQYASYDQLTNVLTRKKGLELSHHVFDRWPNHPHTICFIDVDNLKHVNDQYGHEQGDQLIVDVVDFIRTYIRADDIMFRYGGDEFVIVFIKSTHHSVTGILDRMYAALTVLNQARTIEISFSCGLASHDHEETLEELINLADQKMYEVKQKRKTNKTNL